MHNNEIKQTSRKVLIIIGPSGSGKSTIVTNLVKRGRLSLTPTWTTRPRRHYETGERFDHLFVNDQEFDAQLESGYFYETVTLFGLPYRYGLPFIDFDTVQGVPTIMLRSFLLHLTHAHIDEYSVYQIERPYESTESHMSLREETDGEIGDRLDRYDQEVQQGRKQADRIIVNDDTIETAVATFENFLLTDFGPQQV